LDFADLWSEPQHTTALTPAQREILTAPPPRVTALTPA